VGAGYAIGAFVIGTFAYNPAQYAAEGAPIGPPGVTYSVAKAEIVAANTTPAGGACISSNLGTMATPTALTDGAQTGLCLSTNASGFVVGDIMYVFEVVWDHTALNATEFEVQIGVQVTPATHNIVATSFVKTSATITVNETAVFAVDLTQAKDTGVTGYQLLVTEL
jgi:hypothetical protein